MPILNSFCGGLYMNIKEAKQQIQNAITAYLMKDEFGEYRIPLEKQRPVFLLGAPGIGKTAIMEQIAQETGISLVSYSMTHHTRESVLGLAQIVHRNYTGADFQISEYTMSEIVATLYDTIEATGIKEGILFLDEINCVAESLAPVMLQFLQYKMLGKHQIPTGWVVCTAGNPPEFNKSVNVFDVVTMDRLKKVDVEPDFGIWKEYAYKQHIHTAITCYLESCPEDFYHIGKDENGDIVSFVTARGWEDLSLMMLLYEEDGINIDNTLIEQYIQAIPIATRFLAYYSKYVEYYNKYYVDDILEGNVTEDIIESAKAAVGDEKRLLFGMIIESVSKAMRDSLEMEKMLKRIQPLLQDTIARLNANFSNREILSQHIMKQQSNLEKLTRARVISPSDKRIMHWIIYSLTIYMDKTTKCRDNPRAVQCVMQEFQGSLAKMIEVTDQAIKKMQNAFTFVEACFDKGPEIDFLYNELKACYHCQKFMHKYSFENYRGGPTHSVDFSKIEHLALDPNAKD